MLFLKKEIDETIVIDGDIKITVMEIQHGEVMFGIDIRGRSQCQ